MFEIYYTLLCGSNQVYCIPINQKCNNCRLIVLGLGLDERRKEEIIFFYPPRCRENNIRRDVLLLFFRFFFSNDDVI